MGTCTRVNINCYKAQAIPSKYLGEPDIVLLAGKANKFRARMKLCVSMIRHLGYIVATSCEIQKRLYIGLFERTI